MNILAFDTALCGCSAALYDSSTGACEAGRIAMPTGQAEALVPMVQEVIAAAGAVFSDIDLIAVTVGPGAFTGIRIGLATARGFGLALEKPVCGLITTETLAAQYFTSEKTMPDQMLCVLLETKRKDFYAQFFGGDGVPLAPPQAISGAEIKILQGGRKTVFIGDALGRFAKETDGDAESVFREGYELPDPCLMARLALEKSEKDALLPPEPLYLRGADVTMSKKPVREIATG